MAPRLQCGVHRFDSQSGKMPQAGQNKKPINLKKKKKDNSGSFLFIKGLFGEVPGPVQSPEAGLDTRAPILESRGMERGAVTGPWESSRVESATLREEVTLNQRTRLVSERKRRNKAPSPLSSVSPPGLSTGGTRQEEPPESGPGAESRVEEREGGCGAAVGSGPAFSSTRTGDPEPHVRASVLWPLG